MDKRYHTVRMDKSPQVGSIFSSSLLNPAPAPDKWWKVMFSPVQLAGVPGGFAVTLQECDPKPRVKGVVGEHIYGMLRDLRPAIPLTPPPEPTLGMIYAEVAALRNEWNALRQQQDMLHISDYPSLRVAVNQMPAKWPPIVAEESHTCVFEFSEDRVPTFRDGPPSSQHELETIVDAERCTALVKLADELQQDNTALRLKLHGVIAP